MTSDLLSNRDKTLEAPSRLLLERKNDYAFLAEKQGLIRQESETAVPADAMADLWKMKSIFEAAIQAMGQMMELRDPYTAGHQARVSRISVEIAGAMDLPTPRIKGIQLAALIHDIGKLAIPAELLSKPGRLTQGEFDLIKTHPSVGHGIVKDIQFPWPLARIVLQHHERINGSGYPGGLHGLDILLEARIIAVADVIEAMSSNRPYRPALGVDLAIEEIQKNKNVLYDGNVVEACLKCFANSRFNLDPDPVAS
jgi:HD-GYP domain-containing protein (c-di-GMP phosphodiesterase class II)